MEFPASEVYERLFERWGAQHWWPGRTKMEIVVGAILTQNTNWSNVERAIVQLRQARCLNFKALEAVPESELAQMIRPAGYFNVKARRLKSFVIALGKDYGGSLRRLFSLPLAELREWLLAVNGIGPETADSIMLYAAGKPVFVIDAYTRRFMSRHGWCPADIGYEELARCFAEQLPEDAGLFNEFHALIVRLGKEHCRTKARCEGCPLAEFAFAG